MQTVNFQCGGCGKLMAVSSEYLGQQVRCPHCQQVVIAPSSVSPPAPSPAPAPDLAPFTNLGEHEDIFTIKSETHDVLFGSESRRHDLPRPSDPGPTHAFNGPALSDPSPAELPPLEPTVSPDASTLTTEPPSQSPHWNPVLSNEAPVESSPGSHEQTGFVPTPRRREAKESFVSMPFLLLVFMPVLLWAICATGIGFWLYGQVAPAEQQKGLFDQMPDDGDQPGATRPKGKVRARIQSTKELVTRPLPDHLKVKLEETVRVGDLEVTPLKVSKRPVRVFVEGFSDDQRCENDSLVLDLKLKNVARDYSFVPLDNYFDRRYKGVGPVPFTLVQSGKETFYGGPAVWVSLTRPATKKDHRQWLAGRKNVDPVGLAPGEEMESYVCTDGDDRHMAAYLFGEGGKRQPYRGPLVWRVQVRRGLIAHKGRQVSATSVIGVEFTDADIKR